MRISGENRATKIGSGPNAQETPFPIPVTYVLPYPAIHLPICQQAYPPFTFHYFTPPCLLPLSVCYPGLSASLSAYPCLAACYSCLPVSA